MSDAVTISDLHVAFDGKTVLRNFSMTVARGEKVVLVGESGSGKSTLLNCLMGFVHDVSGAISIEGTPLSAETVWHARRRMALVQQEPDPGNGVVRDILIRPFHFKENRHARITDDDLEGMLARFRLSPDILEKDFSDLSGGQKQRATLISALLLTRPILLLDEITSALDEVNTAAVVNYLAALEDTTVIAVAHDKELRRIGDRIVTLNGGES